MLPSLDTGPQHNQRMEKRCRNNTWYAANREKVLAKIGALDASGKAARAEKNQAWHVANRATVRARRKAMRLANPERFRAYQKKWRVANPEKVRAINRGIALRHHGLTLAQFNALLAAQGGACRICEAVEPGGYGTWHIDHDHECCPGNRHSCGRCVRGLLCHHCNLMLGNARDNPEVLLRAIAYLERPKALRAVER